LPWEITTIYSEVLKQSGHQSDDEEDEDDIEAHEASIQRLKVNSFLIIFYLPFLNLFLQEADDATRQMTREEYQHYSDCRQASFTYRKGTPIVPFILNFTQETLQPSAFVISSIFPPPLT
jgi:transcription initiation protein SPT3